MKIRGSFLVVVLAVLGGLASAARADSLQLHDGRHFEGQYVGGTASVVAFLTQGSVQYFPVNDVVLVAFGGSANRAVNPLRGDGSSLAPMSGKCSAPGPIKPRSARLRRRKPGPQPRLLKARAEL
jgi:hypothetical protein